MNEQRIISRSQATAAGLARYFTGKACRKGHIAERAVKGGHCAACDRARIFPKRKYVWTEKKAAVSFARYHRDVEKSRAHSRAAGESRRRQNGQLTMADYRAQVHEKYLARKAEKAKVREATKAIRDEARKASSASHQAASADRRREQGKAWRAANPGKSQALQKTWRENNREKRRANKRARKATKRITLVRDLTKLQRGRCAYCRVRLVDGFHVDHVQPLKRGGPDQRSNLQLTCGPCNLTKSAKDPIDFARSTGRLI